MWRIAFASDSYRPDSQDRGAVAHGSGCSVVAVADGVGGRRGGAEAAEVVVRAAVEIAPDPNVFLADPLHWLAELDLAISRDELAGESTAVVAVLTASGVVGVAVGDSAAWNVRPNTLQILSQGSEPKPWLGWGSPTVRSFALPADHTGTLILATDGLLKYAPTERIRAEALTHPFEGVPARLIDLARRPSGGLNDDVAVIAVRREL